MLARFIIGKVSSLPQKARFTIGEVSSLPQKEVGNDLNWILLNASIIFLIVRPVLSVTQLLLNH